jgi:hypothetical protein
MPTWNHDGFKYIIKYLYLMQPINQEIFLLVMQGAAVLCARDQVFSWSGLVLYCYHTLRICYCSCLYFKLTPMQ